MPPAIREKILKRAIDRLDGREFVREGFGIFFIVASKDSSSRREVVAMKCHADQAREMAIPVIRAGTRHSCNGDSHAARLWR